MRRKNRVRVGAGRIPLWLRKIRRPWIVADWGSLRALPRGGGIPGTASTMIPDVALKEMLGSDKPEAYFHKLNELVFHPTSRNRIVVGRYWNDISVEESTPARIISSSVAAAHLQLSRDLIQMQSVGQRFSLAAGPDDIEKRKAHFVDLCNRFSSWMHSEHPDGVRKLRSNPESLAASIQAPSAAMGSLLTSANTKYGTPAWASEAARFPDRCAAARWMRTVVWYANQRILQPDVPDDRFSNNYEDAHYVFLSLYTGHLWTLDRGMLNAALGVSGGRVRVHRKL